MSRRTRAFTLIELLVSIAIIVLLVSALVVALKKARYAAQRTESSGALRQIMSGYVTYAEEHKGILLPGYLGDTGGDPSKNDAEELGLRAKLPHLLAGQTTDVLPAEDCRSYVWRLAPYLGNAWKTYMVDYRSDALLNQFTNEYEQGKYGSAEAAVANIAMHPAFGLNSIFVGGDSYHGALEVHQASPWFGPDMHSTIEYAATRISHVKSPSKLIVFAPSAQSKNLTNLSRVDSATDTTFGYVELRAPYLLLAPQVDGLRNWTRRQWFIDGDNQLMMDPFDTDTPSHFVNGAGFLIDRISSPVFRLVATDSPAEDRKRPSGNTVPVGQLDGSVGIYNPAEGVAEAGVDSPKGRRFIMSRWTAFPD